MGKALLSSAMKHKEIGKLRENAPVQYTEKMNPVSEVSICLGSVRLISSTDGVIDYYNIVLTKRCILSSKVGFGIKPL